MKLVQRFLPLAVGLFCLMIFGRALVQTPYKNQEFDLNQFSQYPVLHSGRVKPLDSFARNNLMIITDKQSYKDKQGVKQPAIKWLAHVMANTTEAAELKVFRIEHDNVLTLMGLEPRKETGFRYSLNELKSKYPELVNQARAAFQKEEASRDLVEVKILELYNQLEIYRQIMNFEIPLMLPPKEVNSPDWKPLGAEKSDLELTTPANAWYKSLKAFQQNDPVFFNAVTREHIDSLKSSRPDLFPRLSIEQRFNLSQPFYQAMILFVFAFLFSVFSWMFWGESLNRSAFVMVSIALVIFTGAMLVRMYLQGRPPVTNLYSSAIFVGWVAVILGLGVEWFLKNGFGTVMASMTGFASLLVAHNLTGEGDTMEMMRAVLDTNFWLATHVTTVTMGYSACYLAGFMAIVLVLMGVLTKKLDKDLYNKISAMIYGTIAFATLFSFVGTVLGGIWADQSWGRFWGWDPKENGAVMIVLWNAVVLHARWGGLAKKQGIALLAIGGNIITTWSWFGVNMLGVGLHSYGFTDGAFLGLAGFILGNLLIICLGSIPLENWRSYPNIKPKRGPRAQEAQPEPQLEEILN